MPEKTEIHYITLNGQPPNGGVPSGRKLFSVAINPGLVGAGHGHPPPYDNAPNDGKTSQRADIPQPLSFDTGDTASNIGHPAYPTQHSGPPVPGPPARQSSAPTAPPSNRSRYEPPGQYLDGHMVRGDGYTYLHPSEHTTINFLGDGERPCDAPYGYYPYPFDYSTHRVPTSMTVRELFSTLGMPAVDHYGITEMEKAGDDRWTAVVTVTQGSPDADRTLRSMGWTQRRSELAGIWICVKR